MYSYLCRFLSFPSFFLCFFPFLFPSFPSSLSFFLSFFFSFFLLRWLRVLLASFFFAFVCQLLNSLVLRSLPIFFIRFSFLLVNGTSVTLPPSPPQSLHHPSNHFPSWPLGDQLVVPRGVTHISCHYKNTIEGAG